MSKAGLFAGEVTTAAPADQARTDKPEGYLWMQYIDRGNPFVLFIKPLNYGPFPYDFILPLPQNHHDTGVPLVYDFVVDWGDGTTDHITSWNQAEVTHNYTIGDDYIIAIYGTCEGWRFADGGSKDRLYEIRNWGELGFKDITQGFSGCLNMDLTAVDKPDLSGCDSLEDTFRSCIAFKGTGLEYWDVSTIKNMAYTFAGCNAFNCNLGWWDVGLVESLQATFAQCHVFTGQYLWDWDTASVTNMENCFTAAFAFNEDLSRWNVESVNTPFLDIFVSTSLSRDNYDKLLVGWAAQTVNPGLTMFLEAQYTISVAQASRDILTNAPNNWFILDGGGV